MASAPSATITRPAAITGRRMTSATQRAPSVGLASSAIGGERLAAHHPRAAEAEQRRDEREAGEHGDRDRAGGGDAHLGQERRRRSSASATSAIMTVEPAKTTALPAVPVASAIESSMRMPVAHLRAVAGEDEQRVVDADREAEHRRQRGRGRGQVGQPAGELDAEHADADAEERGQQRQAGGEQRAEGDRRARTCATSTPSTSPIGASLSTAAADPPYSTCGAASCRGGLDRVGLRRAPTSACGTVNCRSV